MVFDDTIALGKDRAKTDSSVIRKLLDRMPLNLLCCKLRLVISSMKAGVAIRLLTNMPNIFRATRH